MNTNLNTPNNANDTAARELECAREAVERYAAYAGHAEYLAQQPQARKTRDHRQAVERLADSHAARLADYWLPCLTTAAVDAEFFDADAKVDEVIRAGLRDTLEGCVAVNRADAWRQERTRRPVAPGSAVRRALTTGGRFALEYLDGYGLHDYGRMTSGAVIPLDAAGNRCDAAEATALVLDDTHSAVSDFEAVRAMLRKAFPAARWYYKDQYTGEHSPAHDLHA